jgi:hypothetical protein
MGTFLPAVSKINIKYLRYSKESDCFMLIYLYHKSQDMLIIVQKNHNKSDSRMICNISEDSFIEAALE